MSSSKSTVESLFQTVYKGTRDTDSNPLRGEHRFCVTSSVVSKKDRDNPRVLRRVLYEEKIKRITRRLTLPTISMTVKSEILHPVMKGHDVNTIEVWNNMPNYDNHFLKLMYDKRGSSRILNNRRKVIAGQSLNGCDSSKAYFPPASQRSKESYHYDSSCPDRLSYRQQWTTHQKHFKLDFKRPSNSRN